MRGGLKNYQNDFKFMICMFLTITKRYRYAPKKFEEKNFFWGPLTDRLTNGQTDKPDKNNDLIR